MKKLVIKNGKLVPVNTRVLPSSIHFHGWMLGLVRKHSRLNPDSSISFNHADPEWRFETAKNNPLGELEYKRHLSLLGDVFASRNSPWWQLQRAQTSSSIFLPYSTLPPRGMKVHSSPINKMLTVS